MQAGWMSTLTWVIPVVFASVFFITNTWGQSEIKISFGLLSTNSETQDPALPGVPLLVFSLMGFILMSNLLGLIPFTYGTTSNIWIVGGLALTFWSMLVLSGWLKYPKESSAQLAPSGSPAALIPLLVLIETVSITIRPLTLMVRLIANISAGHIIMSLVANLVSVAISYVGVSTFLIHVGYNIFELFVCFIQAYIFSLLIKLYSEEHPK